MKNTRYTTLATETLIVFAAVLLLQSRASAQTKPEKGKLLQVLHKKDVVTIPPGTLHWHGAAPDSSFTQMVINPNIEKGVVNWLQKVSDGEYNSK